MRPEDFVSCSIERLFRAVMAERPDAFETNAVRLLCSSRNTIVKSSGRFPVEALFHMEFLCDPA